MEENVEAELTSQLEEQREALSGVVSALQEESNSELEEMKVLLEEAVKELESALLQLRKERLMSTLEMMEEAGAVVSEHRGSPVASCSTAVVNTAYPVGHNYRLRHTDGRWYEASLISCSGDIGTMQFVKPTLRYMLRPVAVPLASLQPLKPPRGNISQLSPGSLIVARDAFGLWIPAELEALNSGSSTATVTFVESGVQAVVPLEHVSASAYADVSGSDSESDAEFALPLSSDDEANDSEVNKDPEWADWGSRHERALASASASIAEAAERGAQTDTTHFATWEAHTRGIASKLLANMGYVSGRGLGPSGEGRGVPLQVSLYRQGAGLGSQPLQAGGNGTSLRKKKKRGGERSRRQKHAAAQRAVRDAKIGERQADEEAAGAPSLFAFMNNHLGDASEAAAVQRAQHGGQASSSRAPQSYFGAQRTGGRAASLSGKGGADTDRRSLVSAGDNIASLKAQVLQLRQMAARNAGDKLVSGQVARRLAQASAALQAAQGEQASTQKAIHEHERQKKWMKF